MSPAARAKKTTARRVMKKSVRTKRTAASRKTGRRAAKKRARPKKKTARRGAKTIARVRKHTRPRKKTAGASKKTARRAKTRGAGKRRVRPRLQLVRRPARRSPRASRAAAESPSAFPQKDGASTKQLLMFELVRGRTAFAAAIQGMLPSSAERPLGEGKWSAREIVLHLASRDRIRLREMEAALRGLEPSWRGITDVEQSMINEQDLAALRHLSWDDAVRLLHATRQELMDSIESVPDQPAEVWTVEHPFGWMMHRLPAHDRHHADAIKTWRTESGV